MRTMNNKLILLGSIFITLMFFSSSFGSTITYTYDNLNRLTRVAYENGITEEFTYDAAGNRKAYTVTIAGNQNGLPGDINNDTRVDLADAILALKIIGGLNPDGIRADYAISGADVNKNGRIGLPEAIYILQKVAGLR